MSAATIFGLCAAAAVGLGLYGLIANPQPLRKILAFNLLGSGVFLVFGVVARRGAASGFGGDPVPQALVITGIVVAFSATALAVALLLRLFQATASATVRAAPPPSADTDPTPASCPIRILCCTRGPRVGFCWCLRLSSRWRACSSPSLPAGAGPNGSCSEPCRSGSRLQSRFQSSRGKPTLRSSICSAGGLPRSASR